MGTAESDRRKIPDRRIEDDGPPKGKSERRVIPERRAMDVTDMDIDEHIDLKAYRWEETDISGQIYTAGEW